MRDRVRLGGEQYSQDELQRHIRVERLSLSQELSGIDQQIRRLTRDRAGIVKRLSELDEAEDLLELWD